MTKALCSTIRTFFFLVVILLVMYPRILFAITAACLLFWTYLNPFLLLFCSTLYPQHHTLPEDSFSPSESWSYIEKHWIVVSTFFINFPAIPNHFPSYKYPQEHHSYYTHLCHRQKDNSYLAILFYLLQTHWTNQDLGLSLVVQSNQSRETASKQPINCHIPGNFQSPTYSWYQILHRL